MAAFDAARWIEEAVRSIDRQKLRKGWTHELRIAVDACEETSSRLLELGRYHWFSPDRMGPYVLRNTLIELEEADAYATFDADDIMEPVYLDVLLALAGRDAIAGSARKTIDPDGRVLSRRSRYQHGVSVIGHDAWKKLGGFRPWMIVADSELVARAKVLRIPVRSTRQSLYRRRRWPGSLTRAEATRIGSKVRELHRAEGERLRRAGQLYVEPRTTHLERRMP